MPSRRRSRYLSIFRGGRAEEIDRLIGFLRGTRQVNYPERRGNRPPQRATYAKPFLSGLGENFYIEASVNDNRWGTISSAIGNRVKLTLTSEESGLKVPRFYNPRAVFTFGISQTGTAKTSQITGRSYKDYGGDSAVSQFGRTTGTQNPSTEFNQIKTAFIGTQTASRRVSYIPPSY